MRLQIIASCLLLGSGVCAQEVEHGGYTFKRGEGDFASRVADFTFGDPAPTKSRFLDPQEVVGLPDYRSGVGAVSLGNGGQVTLVFDGPPLTPSGDDAPDVVVFEVGSSGETSFLSISEDGENFIQIARLSQGTTATDIDAALAEAGVTATSFPFVRITDEAGGTGRKGDTAGADIDAVGLLSRLGDDTTGPTLTAEATMSGLQSDEETAAAKEAADATTRQRWQGLWRQSWNGGFTVNLVSTNEGAHLVINLRDFFCTAAFEPGASPEEMTEIAHFCPSSDREITNLRLEEARDEKLRIAMEINGRKWDVEIPKQISLPVVPSEVPGNFDFSTAGITLEKTWAQQKADVEARLQSLGVRPDWQTEELSRLLGGVYIHRSNEPDNYRDYEGEHYSVYTIGDGENAVPFGLLRRWLPAADKRPTYDGLLNAVRGRYGPETRLITTNRASRDFTIGLNWSFTRDGTKMQQGCGGPSAFSHALRVLPGHSVGLLSLDLTAPWRYGCGIQLYFNHSAPEAVQEILAMQAVLIDSSPIELMLWDQYSSDVAARIERVKESAARLEAEKRAKDEVQPDL